MDGAFIVTLIVIFVVFAFIVKKAWGNDGGTQSYEANSVSIPQFAGRLIDQSVVTDDGRKLPYKAMEMRGLIPVSRPTQLGCVITLLDVTGASPQPVISYHEDMQEHDSPAFRYFRDIRMVEPGMGLTDWMEVGRIAPPLLHPPFSGKRKLRAELLLIDVYNPPHIEMGFVESGRERIITRQAFTFEHHFSEKGYRQSEDKNKARSVAIKLGMAVAYADGHLHELEGEVIGAWIRKNVEPHSDSKQEELKELFNSAARDAYRLARRGDLDIDELIDELNALDERKIKYEAVELCYAIMAADGEVAPEELQHIKEIGEKLHLDMEELARMKDKQLVKLAGASTTNASIEEIVGINPQWDKKKIRAHLTAEFQKWNNRKMTLPEGEQREHAQTMLDKIAEAREKYFD